MSKSKETKPRFRVGDWVSLLYGVHRVQAQVVEDRGPIGVKGRRLYDIRLEFPRGDITTFAVPEEYLEPAEAPDKATQPNG